MVCNRRLNEQSVISSSLYALPELVLCSIAGRGVSFDDFMDIVNCVVEKQNFTEEELLQAFRGTVLETQV